MLGNEGSEESLQSAPAWQSDADYILSLDMYGERPEYLVSEISSRLNLYRDEQTRIEIARYIAPRNGRRASEYFDLFQIADPHAKVEIAKAAAYDHARRTSWHFQMFQIVDESGRYEVARTAAFSNGLGLSEFIHNYELQDVHYRIEVLRRALLSDTASLEHFHSFFREYEVTSIKANPTIEDIMAWLPVIQSQLPHIIPQTALTLYDDMRRREAGIRLLAAYLGNPQVENSRHALEELTGFPATRLKDKGYSQNTLGDLYEIITDLQIKYFVKCFSRVRIEDALLDPANLPVLIEFANNFNLISQLLGDSAHLQYNNLIDEMQQVTNGVNLNGEKGHYLELSVDNTPMLNNYLRNRFLDLFNRHIDWGEMSLTQEAVARLTEQWGDITVVLSLAARYNGRPEWKKQLPVLSNIARRVIDGSFFEYKYRGDPGNPTDLALVEEQIGFLTSEQLIAWRKNQTTLLVADTSSDERKIENNVNDELRMLAQGFINGSTSLNNEVLDELDIAFKEGDKRLQRTLRQRFGDNHMAMMEVCLDYLSRLDSPDTIRKGLSRIKSLKDLLKITPEIKQKLEEISSSLVSKRSVSQRLIFTAIFDDPKLMMSLGNLVRSSSCLNFNNGSEAPAVLAGVMDPNIKAIASFVIGPDDNIGLHRFQALISELSQHPDQVSVAFNPSKKILDIATTSGQYRINLENAFNRAYLKIGQTPSKKVGVKMEKPSWQMHQLTKLINEQVDHLYRAFAASIGADTNDSIYIPITRNPGGSYSDVAVGHQSGSYIMQ